MDKNLFIYFLIIIIFSFFTLYKCKPIKKVNKIQRHLQEDDDENEVPFKKLSIYYDLVSLNGNIEGNANWLKNKNTFNQALNEVKDILEEYIEIRDDEEQDILENIDEWDLGVFNEAFFGERENMNLHNCYIIFKVGTLNEENSIASSKIIMEDDYSTPKLHIITLNENIPNIVFPLKFFKTLILHQITHLLGFHITDYEFTNGISENEDGKYIMTKDNYPNVINYARDYFNCQDESFNIEIELEVDKDDNIHWPSRLLLGEYMTKFNYYEEQVISGFTLAYFEGLDYIKINQKYTGGLMRFGKNKGCQFLKNNCASDEKLSYANEFYLPSSIDTNYINSPEPSCSSGRLSKTVHKLYHYDTQPLSFEYYKDNYAGPSWTNYCPISEYQNDDKLNNVYEGSCSNGNNGDKSFCVLNSLTTSNTESNIKAECLSMSCSEKSLSIQLGNEYVVCPRSGGKIEVEGYSGYILCPDYNLICTGTTLCNDIFDCIEKKSEEKIPEYEYTILTTQDSTVYSEQQLSEDGYELSNDGICTINCVKCNVNKCLICAKYYHVENNICVENVLNCDTYKDENYCKICKSGFDQVYNDDVDENKLSCIHLDDNEKNKKYFSETIDGLIYYKKCSKGIQNCEECSSSNVCTKCIDGYSTIDNDKSHCENLSTNKYYYDSTAQVYKLCTEKLNYCERCSLNNDIFKCLECSSGYSILYENTYQCKENTFFENNGEYFLNEDDNIYYKCSDNKHHSVSNCKLCSNKNICDTCETGYTKYNLGGLCITSGDQESYFRQGETLILCSDAISGCNKCTSGESCDECHNNFILDENDKCFHESFISIKYYYDPTLGEYINCNKLENCDECSSKDKCTKCIYGFQAQEGKCIKTEQEMKDHDKLMALAIAGIVLGTIAIVGVILIIAYILWKKLFDKKNAYFETIEGKNLPSENNENNVYNQIEIQSTKKRSIHN